MCNTKNLTAHIIGLPCDVKITKFKTHPHSIELFVSWKEPVGNARVCPACGGTHCVKKDSGAMQTVRHIPKNSSTAILITFHKPRFLCKSCGKTFFVKPSWVVPFLSCTWYLVYEIFRELVSTTHSLTAIARHTCTSPAIVLAIMLRIPQPKPESLPQTLCIDEFHGKTGTYNPQRKRFDVERYHCVVVDGDKSYVTDILYKATFPFLREYFMEYPLEKRMRVRFFCADMRSGFSKVARSCFPKAKICVDPFHVVKLLTSAISTVRQDEWRRLHKQLLAIEQQIAGCDDKDKKASLKKKRQKLSNECDTVKCSQKLLVTSPYNESRYWTIHEDKRDQRLKALFALAPSLELPYTALMDFYDVTHLSSFPEKRKKLAEWISEYKDCDCSPLKQAVNSISLHRKGIENAWHYNKSNSPAEGLNRKVKDCRRLAFGAHSFENFRMRALLACGSDVVLYHHFTVGKETASPNVPENFKDLLTAGSPEAESAASDDKKTSA